MNYWIYLGRGKFEKALDVAQNIGDTQLILHAYTNLYESVRSNVNMNGSEKQKKLSEYEKKIKELSSEIGEKVRMTVVTLKILLHQKEMVSS